MSESTVSAPEIRKHPTQDRWAIRVAKDLPNDMCWIEPTEAGVNWLHGNPVPYWLPCTVTLTGTERSQDQRDADALRRWLRDADGISRSGVIRAAVQERIDQLDPPPLSERDQIALRMLNAYRRTIDVPEITEAGWRVNPSPRSLAAADEAIALGASLTPTEKGPVRVREIDLDPPVGWVGEDADGNQWRHDGHGVYHLRVVNDCCSPGGSPVGTLIRADLLGDQAESAQ